MVTYNRTRNMRETPKAFTPKAEQREGCNNGQSAGIAAKAEAPNDYQRATQAVDGIVYSPTKNIGKPRV
jgi:hypothetical protein